DERHRLEIPAREALTRDVEGRAVLCIATERDLHVRRGRAESAALLRRGVVEREGVGLARDQAVDLLRDPGTKVRAPVDLDQVTAGRALLEPVGDTIRRTPDGDARRAICNPRTALRDDRVLTAEAVIVAIPTGHPDRTIARGVST